MGVNYMGVNYMGVNISVEVEIQSPWTNFISGDRYLSLHEIKGSTWQHWFQDWMIAQKLDLSPINAYALSLRLTGDADIQEFNTQYRHQNQPTDVLAFASLERQDLPPILWETQPLELGDIIISVETAARQCQTKGHGLNEEVAWLACHGLLHLLGWDHPTEETLGQMIAEQNRLLHWVGILQTLR